MIFRAARVPWTERAKTVKEKRGKDNMQTHIFHP